MELSYSPDCECDPSATGHFNWLSARQSHSLAPELANTQPPESEELSTIQTPGSNLDQENLPNKVNLSDFIPGVYIHSTPRQRRGASNPTSQFSSPLSPLTPSPPSLISSSSLSSESTPPSLSFLLDCSASMLQPTPHLQDCSPTQAPALLVATLSSGLSSVPPLLTAPPFSCPPNQQPPAAPVRLMANPLPQMPLCGTQNAPKFDGKTPALLPCFLEDVNIIRMAASISEAEKIRTAIRYADLEEAEGWELLPKATAVPASWSNFVDAIKKLYPGCEGANRYCQADIQYLVQEFMLKF